MKKIIAINASPRTTWNTATLVREAARGAENAGAEVEVIDLYKLEKFTGCISCFGCKLAPNQGKCIYRDGLHPVLEKIRQADGLILGTPNYLSDISAACRALYERLVFQHITYKKEFSSYNQHSIPVLFIMTSNVAEDFYDELGYTQTLQKYKANLDGRVGPTKIFVSGNTLQVNDYDRYDWTMFDAAAKQERRQTEFPKELQQVFNLGVQMVQSPWQ